MSTEVIPTQRDEERAAFKQRQAIHYRYMSALALSYDPAAEPREAFKAMQEVGAAYAAVGQQHHAEACAAGMLRIYANISAADRSTLPDHTNSTVEEIAQGLAAGEQFVQLSSPG